MSNAVNFSFVYNFAAFAELMHQAAQTVGCVDAVMNFLSFQTSTVDRYAVALSFVDKGVDSPLKESCLS